MIASPITGLVRGLNALIAGLAIQLQQIAEQGLVGGEAAPEAEAAPAEEAPAEEAQAAEETEETDAPSEGDDDEEKEG